jgi:hypothetical protein
MSYVDDAGGLVDYMRLRGQKIQSRGKFSFAIERESNIPAIPGSHGDFIFSEVGAGIYPLAIVGPSLKSVKRAMVNSDAGIRIEQKGDLTGKGFEIVAKTVAFSEMKQLEIHDAGVDAFKNVALGVAGSLGGAGESLPGKILSAIKDVIGGIFDLKDAHESPKNVGKAFGSKGTKSGLVGVIVNMYLMEGYTRTGQSHLTLKELAEHVFGKSEVAAR